jgi:hypothetical protein
VTSNVPPMNDIRELLRLPSPAPRPQALAYDGSVLWMGSIETRRLYAIDPSKWTLVDETQIAVLPWGMTVVGDELRVVCGEGEDDDRFVRRFVPGHGLRDDGRFACPEHTGSQLGYDGDFLYLSQWYRRRILQLDDAGRVLREIPVSHQVCGQVIVGGRFYLVTTEDENTNDFWLTRVDAHGEQPVCEDLARIPFGARSLTFDGERFWTNHRENNETVAFAHP